MGRRGVRVRRMGRHGVSIRRAGRHGVRVGRVSVRRVRPRLVRLRYAGPASTSIRTVLQGWQVAVWLGMRPGDTGPVGCRPNRRRRLASLDILKIAGGLRGRRRLVSRSGVAGRAVARAHGLHCTGDNQTGTFYRGRAMVRGAPRRPSVLCCAVSATSVGRCPVPSLTSSFTNYRRILAFTARIMGAT